jgi:radical SAM protein with 4Fe4S-binding SPASM domain
MGGEPLLRDDWATITEALVRRGVSVSIVTNGVLFDRDVALRVSALGVTQVVVSLDGGEETHDTIRGTGVFSKAVEALDHSAAVGIPHRMAVTSVSKANAHDLETLLRFLLEHENGIDWAINFSSLRHGGRMDPALRIDERAFCEIAEFTHRARRRAGDRLRITGSHDMGYFSRRYGELAGRDWNGCVAGLEALGIAAGGGIKGCLCLPDHLVDGNIRQVSLRDLWNDPGSFSYNRHFSVGDLRGECARCEHGARCRGGCLEFGSTMTGELHSAPYCLWRIEDRDARA